MSTNSTNREISSLQQDAPVAILPTLSNNEEAKIEAPLEVKSTKSNNLTKPFYLYPRDGLYGLL